MKASITKLLLLQLFFISICSAQQVEHFAGYGTAGEEIGYGTVCDSLGNNYVVGTYQGTLNFGGGNVIQSNQGYIDLFLFKRNNQGDILWATSFGSNDQDNHDAWQLDDVSDIAMDKQGNIYVLGEINTGADIIFGSILIPDDNEVFSYKKVFVAKFDTAGNCKWLTIGKSTNPNAKPYRLAAGNKYISLISESYGSEVYGNDTIKHSGSYIVTVDTSGQVIWAKSYYGTIEDTYYDDNDRLYSTGTTNNTQFDDTTIALIGLSDFYIAQIDTLGNLNWVKNYGCTDKATGFSITGKGDSLYVVGMYEAPMQVGTISLNGNNKLYLSSFTKQGICNWAKIIKSGVYFSSSGNTTDIVVNNINELILLYYDNGMVLQKHTVLNGDMSWSMESASDNGSINGKKIATDNDEKLYVSGSFNGQSSIGDSPVISSVNNSFEDIFCLIVDTKTIVTPSVTAIENNKTAYSDIIELYPNPVSETLHLKANDLLKQANYYIVNGVGIVLKSGIITDSDFQIDFTDIKQGVYVFKIQGEESLHFKIIKN